MNRFFYDIPTLEPDEKGNIEIIHMDSCSQNNVKETIEKLYALLGHETFTRSFPVILTDNGSEFTRPETFELDSNGVQRTKIFYCNPMASYQKPHVEKNHQYIRS